MAQGILEVRMRGDRSSWELAEVVRADYLLLRGEMERDGAKVVVIPGTPK